MMGRGTQSRRGFTTIEVLFATAILVVVVSSIATYYRKLVDGSRSTTEHIQSSLLLEEGVEALKFVRDKGWAAGIGSLGSGTTYYLYWSGATWTTTTTPQKINDLFVRSFVLGDVYRNSTTDNIVPSGAGTYLDAGTKLVTLSVSWQRKHNSGTTTEKVETYISNIRDD